MRPHRARRSATSTSSESDVNELAQAKGANVAGLQVVFSNYGIDFDDIDVFYLAGGFGRHLECGGRAADRADSAICRNRASCRSGNAAIEGASHRAALASPSGDELEELVRRVEHCRLETHPRFFDFFVDGCQFQAGQRLRSDACDVHVNPRSTSGLLGYPRDHVPEGRACELAEAARQWYAGHGRPWVHTAEVSRAALAAFSSRRLQRTFQEAEAHAAILVAVSAGPEAEEEAQQAVARREAGRVFLPGNVRRRRWWSN